MLGPEIPSSTSTDSIFKGHKYFSGKKKKKKNRRSELYNAYVLGYIFTLQNSTSPTHTRIYIYIYIYIYILHTSKV